MRGTTIVEQTHLGGELSRMNSPQEKRVKQRTTVPILAETLKRIRKKQLTAATICINSERKNKRKFETHTIFEK